MLRTGKPIVGLGALAGLILASFVPVVPAGAVTLNASGATFSFLDQTALVDASDSNNVGSAKGDIVLFNNFTIINSQAVDAVMTNTSATSNATLGNVSSSTPNDLPMSATTSSGESRTEFRLDFYQGGTVSFDGSNVSGIPATLTNLSFNTYDLDGAPNGEYVEYFGFQQYQIANAANGLTVTTNPGGRTGWTRFASTQSGWGPSDPESRAKVFYNEVSSLQFAIGVASGSGGRAFNLEAGEGKSWLSASLTRANNPANSAPTSTNSSINVATNGDQVLSVSDFGTFSDADNNPLAKVRIDTVPNSGTIQRFDGINWVTLAANAEVTADDINLGYLRLSNPSTSTSLTFSLNDALVYSASSYTMTINVAGQPQTISFPNPGTKRTDGDVASKTFASNATASSGLTVSLATNSPAVCSVAGLDITVISLGTCSITATQAGDGVNWGSAPSVTRVFSVSNDTPQTITFENPGNQEFGQTLASGATTTSPLAITLISQTTATCTVSGLDITLISVGSCTIIARQSGGSSGGVTYAPASDVSQTFLSVGATPTVTLSYNSASYPDDVTVDTLNKGGSSGAATYSIGAYGAGDRATNCSVDASTGVVSADSAGVCRVLVSIAAAGNYAAGSAEAFATISKSTERILFDTSGPLTVYSTDLQTTRTVNLTQDPNNSEKYAVEIKLGETLALPFNSPNAESPSYSSYFKCPSVVGPGEPKMFPFDSTLAKGQAGYGDSTYYVKAKQTGACVVSGGNPGAQILSLSGASYTTPLSQLIFVNVVKGDQSTISVTGSNSASFGQTVTLDAVGGSGLGDRSFSVTGTGCSIETEPLVYAGVSFAALATGKLTKAGAGDCDVTVTKAGDSKYEPITSAPFTVTFGKGSQAISFTSSVPTQPSAGGRYTPVATASSGLDVSFAAAGSCSYDGVSGQVSFSSSGTCTITASQAGDADYLAASNATQVIAVGERNQTLSFGAVSDKEFGDPAFRVTATSTEAALAVALTSSTTAVCTIDSNGIVTLKAAGTCTLNANQAGQAGVVAAASQVSRSFEVFPAGSSAPFITSVSRGLGSLTATLVPPSYTGGATITKYEVTAFDPNGDIAGFNNNCAVASPQKCTVDGLVEGVNYTLRARAFHNAGFGSMSPDSVAAAPVGNPDAVRELTALAGDTTLTISWLAPLSLGGASFARYDIFLKLASEAAFPATPSHVVNSVADGSYTFSGMTNGESYDVKMVTITDLEGTEINSNTVLVTQVPYTTPNAVRDLSAFELGDDLYITWRYPDFDGGRQIDNYDVDVNLGALGCASATALICVIAKGEDKTFDIQTVANNVAGAGLPASYSYQVPAPPGASSPTPYLGPVVSTVSTRSPIAGQRVFVSGQRLDSITSLSIAGQSVPFTLTLAGGLSFEFPAGLSAGQHDMVLQSSFGLLRVQQVFEVRGGTETAKAELISKAELRTTANGSTKIYIFVVVGAGKVQVLVNGREIAWVNATTNSDPKLRQLPNGDGYLVRTVGSNDVVRVLISGSEAVVSKG